MAAAPDAGWIGAAVGTGAVEAAAIVEAAGGAVPAAVGGGRKREWASKTAGSMTSGTSGCRVVLPATVVVVVGAGCTSDICVRTRSSSVAIC